MAQATPALTAQALAKRAALEKRARRHSPATKTLAVFTTQLASMLNAGLPILTAIDALTEQVEDPVFREILRQVRSEIASGASMSEAVKKFPKAFNNLYTSMVEAGEASGNLAEILSKVGGYLEASVKLTKKVKSAMAYPIAVILLAIVLVSVMLIFVIPVFANMFAEFGSQLPLPTRIIMAASDLLKSYWWAIIIGIYGIYRAWKAYIATPKGREMKDHLIMRMPIFGNLAHKIALSRFCRTYATLMKSGVPILRTLEIVGNASGYTQVERACQDITRHITAGGQVSDAISSIPFFPNMLRHMIRAGEQTGNVDGMMVKVADFYDNEADSTISALTSLIEPLLIVFLGVFVGSIVVAMFLPIFNLSNVVGG
jgi:type IV pilus assembly protein PilC